MIAFIAHATMGQRASEWRCATWQQVITYYLGFVVELPFVWDAYKSARAALANTTQPTTVNWPATAVVQPCFLYGSRLQRGFLTFQPQRFVC